MTAAAEDHRTPAPPVAGNRRRWIIAALAAAGLVFGSACTADGVADGSTRQPAASAAEPSASPTIPQMDEQAIRGTIEAMNAAADGVAGQQAALAALVDPALVNALDDCAPATTTLRFEPTYPGLRPAPGWEGSSGSLSGTVYALPTLIRIYTGGRITGTDLTTLHFGVQAGEAYLTPLCVG